jgi:hypothetical protein
MIRVFLLVSILLFSIDLAAAQEDELANCAAKTDVETKLKCFEKLANAASKKNKEADGEAYKDESSNKNGDEDAEVKSLTNLWSIAKLESDDPNFFGLSGQAGDAKRGVRNHIEFDISIKYPLWSWTHAGVIPNNLFFVYNGSYDFQALTNDDIYDSKPIISTAQNPGLALEWKIGDGTKKFRFAYFHHSNGQTWNESHGEEDSTLSGATATNTSQAAQEFNAIVKAAGGEAPALERLSRSSWYWQYRYQWMSNAKGDIDNKWAQLQLELRYLHNTDDKIFWDPLLTHQPRLQDFDGIRLLGEKMWSPSEYFRVLWRLKLQTGTTSVFDNVGGEISAGLNLRNIWKLSTRDLLLSLYYYSGYAKDIASYHTRTKHWGLGLELR